MVSLQLFAMTVMGAVEVSSSSGIPIWVYIIGTLFTGGLLTILHSVYRRWRFGQIEDTELINRITQETVKGADDILAQYRLEMEVVKRRIEDYQKELHNLTTELANATVRIVKLELELDQSQAERDRLHRELVLVKEEREHLKQEINFLNQKIDFYAAQQPLQMPPPGEGEPIS